MESKGVAGWTPTELYVDPERLDEAKALLHATVPGFLVEHFAREGAGEQVRRIGFENSLGPAYFRGLSKIAFHAALNLMPQLDGHAWEFDVLRRFIRYDQRPLRNPVARLERSVPQMIGLSALPRRRGHIIVASTHNGELTASLQFFLDSALSANETPPPWAVRIGRLPAGFALTSAAVFAAFFDEDHRSGHDGELISIRV
jgi:hypothetical protein